MRVLVLQTSLRDGDSASRALVDTYLHALRIEHGALDITVRDFATDPIPHLAAELVPVQLALTESDSPAAQLSEKLIRELEASDVIVIGLAMYNFAIPSTLKAWIDHIVRARRTFTYTEQGPAGLLPKGKKVVALIASGGVYSAGPAQPMDFTEPYLRTIFGFVGITEVEVARAEGLAAPGAADAIELGKSQARQLAA